MRILLWVAEAFGFSVEISLVAVCLFRGQVLQGCLIRWVQWLSLEPWWDGNQCQLDPWQLKLMVGCIRTTAAAEEELIRTFVQLSKNKKCSVSFKHSAVDFWNFLTEGLIKDLSITIQLKSRRFFHLVLWLLTLQPQNCNSEYSLCYWHYSPLHLLDTSRFYRNMAGNHSAHS